jgi:hypothetical protein
MPIRFRRTLRVAPGVKLNFSKSGVSTTVGPKGFHFTFGKKGVRRTVSIPGTGVSEVDYIKKNETEAQKEKREKRAEEHDDQPTEHESRAEEPKSASKASHRRHEEAVATTSNELRNAFVLLGVVVFFFAGAAMLGLMPAHFISNSLQYLAHIVQSTGH